MNATETAVVRDVPGRTMRDTGIPESAARRQA
jgi:hypothetical protein